MNDVGHFGPYKIMHKILFNLELSSLFYIKGHAIGIIKVAQNQNDKTLSHF